MPSVHEDPDDAYNPDTAQFDRFGFIRGESETPAEAQSQATIETEARRVDKWLAMLAAYDRWAGTAKFRQRVRKGVPSRLRAQVWTRLSGAEALAVGGGTGYYAGLRQKPTSWTETIGRDITRTFPAHEMFRRNKAGQAALFNVLQAYAVHNEAVGYCQGMGFIAGTFLIYMPEEAAFWMFVRIMDHYPMAQLFGTGMPALPLYFYQLSALLRENCPKLHRHLDAENIHVSMYATQWFVTVFAYSLPFEIVVRVWDMFLDEGNVVLFRVAIAILQQLQKRLLSESGLDKLVPTLTALHQSGITIDIIDAACALEKKVTDFKLAKLQARFVKEGMAPGNFQPLLPLLEDKQSQLGRLMRGRSLHSLTSLRTRPRTSTTISQQVSPVRGTGDL